MKLYFFPENLKKFWVSTVNLGRVGLPLTQVFFIWPKSLILSSTTKASYLGFNLDLIDCEPRIIFFVFITACSFNCFPMMIHGIR